jgi:hypothetical protein
MSEPGINTSYSLPAECHAALDAYATRTGIPRVRVLATAIRWYLSAVTGAPLEIRPGDSLSPSVLMLARTRGLPPAATPSGFDPVLDGTDYATEGDSADA